jgi:hypothetical protein
VIFTLIPDDIGIHDNTVVDQEAKDELHDQISNCSIIYTDGNGLVFVYGI